MKKFTFKTKTFVDLPRKTKKDKRIHLNLNTYRNLHHTENNNVKKLYKQIMMEQIKECPKFDKPVKVEFKLIKSSRRRTDKSNFFSVISKFLYDALVEEGKLVDDNDDFILTETLLPTEYEKSDYNIAIITFIEV